MHKKRIRDSFYYYTTIRKGDKTDSVYLGKSFIEAKKKEISLKSLRLNLIILAVLFLVSISIVFADSIPINVRPLSGGSIQASTAFDYQFNFTSNQDCSTVLHSVTKTVTTDKYGIGFVEIDVSPLNDTPSYLCEYRALSGGALTLRKVHNISTGLFNRSFGKDVKYDKVNITGNLTLGQKTTFSLGSFIQEITNWFISSTSLAVQGDLNVTGNVNVTGYVNASTIYSGGYNVSIWMYNTTEYALTIISTNVSALNASLLAYINVNITNLNASIQYNYNESNYVLTITNTNFTALNESVTKWLYNMSDGSYNESYVTQQETRQVNITNNLNASSLNVSSYANIGGNITLAQRITFILNGYMEELTDLFRFSKGIDTPSLNATNITATLINSTGDLYTHNVLVNSSLQYNMSDRQVDNFNVTELLNATNITTTNISIATANIFWNGSNLIIKG